MSWESEESADSTCKVHYNTATGETKIEDLEAEETWLTPINSSGTDDIEANIVPGFSNGQMMMLIAKKIKEALT